MPAQIDKFWEERVTSLKANNLTWGALRIAREIRKEACSAERGDFPSERWVGSFLHEKCSKLSEAEKGQYLYFCWPESMDRGDLPWEAAPYGLEYLHHLFYEPKKMRVDSNGPHSVDRPTNEQIRWFWKISVAAPTAPLDLRIRMAAFFRWALYKRSEAEIYEWFLAHSPWENRERKAEYLEFLDRTLQSNGESATISGLLRRAREAGMDVHSYYRLLASIADQAEEEDLREEYETIRMVDQGRIASIRELSTGTWRPQYQAPSDTTGKRQYLSETVQGTEKYAMGVLEYRLSTMGIWPSEQGNRVEQRIGDNSL